MIRLFVLFFGFLFLGCQSQPSKEIMIKPTIVTGKVRSALFSEPLSQMACSTSLRKSVKGNFNFSWQVTLNLEEAGEVTKIQSKVIKSEPETNLKMQNNFFQCHQDILKRFVFPEEAYGYKIKVVFNLKSREKAGGRMLVSLVPQSPSVVKSTP